MHCAKPRYVPRDTILVCEQRVITKDCKEVDRIEAQREIREMIR